MSYLETLNNKGIHLINSALRAGKEVPPLVVVELHNNVVMFHYKSPDPKEEAKIKDFVVRYVRAGWKIGAIKAVAIVGEAFYSKATSAALASVMKPSQDPDRKECALVCAWTHEEKAFNFYEIKSGAEGREVGEPIIEKEGPVQIRSWLDPAFETDQVSFDPAEIFNFPAF